MVVGYTPMGIEALREIARQEGAPDPLVDLEQRMTMSVASLASGTATVKPYSADGFTGSAIHFAEISLDDYVNLFKFGGQDEADDLNITLTRKDNEFIFSMSDSKTSDTDDLVIEIPAELNDSIDMVVSLTFPGPVIRANGDISGNTVTWRMPELAQLDGLEAAGSTTPLHAPFIGAVPIRTIDSSRENESNNSLFVVGGVLAIVTILAAAIVSSWYPRRRRSRNPATSSSPRPNGEN